MDINVVLRGETENIDVDRANKCIKEIDSVMKDAQLPERVLVHRGINLTKDVVKKLMSKFTEAANTGEIIELKGYQSTTLDSDMVGNFRGPDYDDALPIYEISANRGVYVTPISAHKHEEELLLPHDAKYKVVGIKKVPFGEYEKHYSVIQLEQVS